MDQTLAIERFENRLIIEGWSRTAISTALDRLVENGVEVEGHLTRSEQDSVIEQLIMGGEQDG